jgi:hypothetical protein
MSAALRHHVEPEAYTLYSYAAIEVMVDAANTLRTRPAPAGRLW